MTAVLHCVITITTGEQENDSPSEVEGAESRVESADHSLSDISASIQKALAKGSKEWGRSKIMIVGALTQSCCWSCP